MTAPHDDAALVRQFLAEWDGTRGEVNRLAAALGVQPLAVSRWLSGRNPVDQRTRLAMAALAAGLDPYGAG